MRGRYFAKKNLPIFDQDVEERRKRHNQELLEIFNRPSIVNDIKRNKLEWAGHVCGKQDTMAQMLQENLRNKRPLDKPRLRWEHGIKKDFLNARGVDYGGMD